MKVPNEIRQMYTDAYNMLVDVYKEEDDLNLGGEEFFGRLLDRMKAVADKHNHPLANDLLLAAYDQAERLWKEKHNAAP